MNGRALLDRLRAAAADLGLGRIGATPVGPSAHAEVLNAWLQKGHGAGMTWWMERTARDSVDLRRRFPWLKSAIVVAQPYLPYDGPRREQEGIVPHVARYAAGRDYHEVLTARLEALAAILSAECPGQTHRVYVDTGAILERELAARAGLGWFGKSANLILEGGDSWVVLGEILTSVDLPATEAVADHCGTCTACLTACPTGAIVDPYVVDANRCLSYLTIEHRGALDDAAARALDDWMFGCDICQEVTHPRPRLRRRRRAASHDAGRGRADGRGGVQGALRRHGADPRAARGTRAQCPSGRRPAGRRRDPRGGPRRALGRRSRRARRGAPGAGDRVGAGRFRPGLPGRNARPSGV
jgi:epoxyqueuosine reductase